MTVSQPGASMRTLRGPRWDFFMRRAINPAMHRMLRGRLHRLAGSDTLMILEFDGRKSGRHFAFPIGYMEREADIVCYSPFRWWVNLQGGASVAVILRGRRLSGLGEVSVDPATVADGMEVYLRHNPGDAMFWKVRLDGDKVPNREDIDRVAPDNAEIRITLDR